MVTNMLCMCVCGGGVGGWVWVWVCGCVGVGVGVFLHVGGCGCWCNLHILHSIPWLWSLVQMLLNLFLHHRKHMHVWERLTRWTVQVQSVSRNVECPIPIGTRMENSLSSTLTPQSIIATGLKNWLSIYLALTRMTVSTTVQVIIERQTPHVWATTFQYDLCVSWNAWFYAQMSCISKRTDVHMWIYSYSEGLHAQIPFI